MISRVFLRHWLQRFKGISRCSGQHFQKHRRSRYVRINHLSVSPLVQYSNSPLFSASFETSCQWQLDGRYRIVTGISVGDSFYLWSCHVLFIILSSRGSIDLEGRRSKFLRRETLRSHIQESSCTDPITSYQPRLMPLFVNLVVSLSNGQCGKFELFVSIL